ncbi:hypothetical protein TGRH88_049400 [Toxoplasma gondii]|uniref:Uncharacterized protein n=1 Tax=Toxoplasma gondii TaxID=5811 RepID=A0A7J6JWC6_TOXGO|nr:hypothetical protein TGRH88_049400 [Toxoplasma gondii]
MIFSGCRLAQDQILFMIQGTPNLLLRGQELALTQEPRVKFSPNTPPDVGTADLLLRLPEKRARLYLTMTKRRTVFINKPKAIRLKTSPALHSGEREVPPLFNSTILPFQVEDH